MKSALLAVNTFNLRHTFESAQPLTFSGDFDPATGRLQYTSDGTQIRIWQVSPRELRIESHEIGRAKMDVAKRFRLSDSLQSIYSKIADGDRFISDATKKYSGLRLTLNDPWETTVMFITSQFNNVKRIRLITKRLIGRFGGQPGSGAGSFPTPQALSAATLGQLSDCGLGFRNKYIKATASICAENGLDLNRLGKLDYADLKEGLLELPGVGDKVADCIALMGYGKLEAFPVDTWVRRGLERLYMGGRHASIKRLHEMAAGRWGALQGYAQLYLFHQGRMRGQHYGI